MTQLALHAPKLSDLDYQLERIFPHRSLMVISLGTLPLQNPLHHHSNSIGRNSLRSDRKLTTANLGLITPLFGVLELESIEDSTSY